MKTRVLAGLLGLALPAAAVWLAAAAFRDRSDAPAWKEVAPGVFRSPGAPAGYALVDGGHALLIDAPGPADGLKARGVTAVDAVLLTHHHRDTAAAAGRFLADKVPVRAPKASAEWLTPDGVAKYWKESLPMRSSTGSSCSPRVG